MCAFVLTFFGDKGGVAEAADGGVGQRRVEDGETVGGNSMGSEEAPREGARRI